jgi:hypothetical protein
MAFLLAVIGKYLFQKIHAFYPTKNLFVKLCAFFEQLCVTALNLNG